jgi:branched-chain amino acid transport system permease protein
VLLSLLIFAILAYSINFITGMTGYVSFGHVLLSGSGAYGMAMLVYSYGTDPLLGVMFGAATGGLVAFAVGAIILRLRGVYFAIATLVVATSVADIILDVPQLGGSSGIYLNVGFSLNEMTYTAWVLTVLAIILTFFIKRGRLGYALTAIKSDENAAKAIGINVSRAKLHMFIISGLFAGAGGAVMAWSTSAVFANVVFSVEISLQILAMIIIGGMATVTGPFVGAIIVYWLYNYFLTVFPGAQLIILGLLIIAVTHFLPGGLVGTVRRRFASVRGFLE